jgi:hypothetical protein
VVVAPLKLHHLFTMRARLPLLLECNVHEVLDTRVFGADTVVMFLLARGARLLNAVEACSDSCNDVGSSDPLAALSIAAISAVRGFGLLASGHEPREERLRQQGYAAKERDYLVVTAWREMRGVGDGRLEETRETDAAIRMCFRVPVSMA